MKRRARSKGQRLGVFLGAVGLLVAATAAAQPTLRPSLAARGESAGVAYRLEGDAVWFVSCAPTCVERDVGFARVPLPEEARGITPRLEVLPVGGGAELLHLVWGGKDGARAYHVLARGARGEGAPEILLKGFAGGSAEAQLLVLGDKKQKSVILGRLRPGALCGRDGWSDARRYDPEAAQFVPTRLPVFGQAERKKAAVLRASALADASEEVLALRLRPSVEVATSEPAWTDGVLTERDGEPWGLLVAEIPADARALALKNLEPAQGAPLWLWIDGELRRVELAETGADVMIALPPAEGARCVILSEDARPTALAEIEVLVPYAGGKSTEALTLALEKDETRGVASRALAARGQEASQILARAYPRLSAPARRAALELAEELEGGARIELVAWSLGSAAERVPLEDKLAARGPEAGRVFEEVLAAAPPKRQAELAPLLLRLAPAEGARVLAARLDEESAARRRAVRESLAFGLNESGSAEAVRGVLLAELARPDAPRRVKVELLRAFGAELARKRPEIEAAFTALVGEATRPSFDELYVLLEPLVIARGSSPTAAQVLASLLGARPALGLTPVEHEAWLTRYWELVVASGELASAESTRAAFELLAHPSVRVRAGATNFLGEHGPKDSAPRLTPLLQEDAWPLVREASAWALGSLAERGAAPEESSRALRDVLDDDTSERVRRASARALRGYTDDSSLRALRDALDDDASPRVRAEAALSLGRRCDVESLDRLTELAQRLQAPLGDGEVEVSLGALVALVTLNPPDREARLAPLLREDVPGPLKAQIQRTIERARPHCGVRAASSR